MYYLMTDKMFVNSYGLSAGASLSLTGEIVLAAGFGILLTKGVPTRDQVANFLTGLSVSISGGAVGEVQYVHSMSGLSAMQIGGSTAVLTASAGISYGTTSPPDVCPIVGFGPIKFRDPYCPPIN
jgi:hypothetical protein